VIYALIAVLMVGVLLLTFVTRASTSGSKRRFIAGGLARRHLNTANRETIQARWLAVESLVKAGQSSNLKAAVIDADKLLDFTLKALGASGSTLGERLRSAQRSFSNYNGVWQAHKLRNQIVHEDGGIVAAQVPVAIKQFRQALEDLGALS
jgi:hypothetical protein